MEKKSNKMDSFDEENREVHVVSENEIPYQNRLDQSIQQAREGKTVKVSTEEELKKLLDNL